MSSGSSQRRKEPLFQQVQEKPLPKPPQPLAAKLADPFEDLPAVGPRSARRSLPELREPEPEPAPAPAKPPAAPLDPKTNVAQPERPAQAKANVAQPERLAQPAAQSRTNVPQPERPAQPVAKKAQFPYPEQPEQPAKKATPQFPYEPFEQPATRAKTTFLQPERFEQPAFERPAFNRPAFDRQLGYDEPHQYWDAPIRLAQRRPGLLLLLIGIVCGAIVWGWASTGSKTFISTYNGGHMPALSEIMPAIVIPANTPPGQHSVLGQPSISAAAIDTVLSEYGSPAAGTGQAWVKIGERYGIDPAYALAFFIHESSAGTNPGWAGLKSDGSSTHNVGNIICAGYATCYGRFRDYSSWEEGIDDWYKLIGNEYINGRSASTVEQIIPIYAPSSDNNDVPAYVQSVVSMVDGWRQGVYR